MPKRKPDVHAPLGTIWELPEQAWQRIEPVLDQTYPPKPTGRPRIDFRAALDGIVYRARTGCQWNHLPRKFGDDSSVHRWFQCWVEDGVFEKFWAILLEECDELGGVDWEWISSDNWELPRHSDHACVESARAAPARRDSAGPKSGDNAPGDGDRPAPHDSGTARPVPPAPSRGCSERRPGGGAYPSAGLARRRAAWSPSKASLSRIATEAGTFDLRVPGSARRPTAFAGGGPRSVAAGPRRTWMRRAADGDAGGMRGKPHAAAAESIPRRQKTLSSGQAIGNLRTGENDNPDRAGLLPVMYTARNRNTFLWRKTD